MGNPGHEAAQRSTAGGRADPADDRDNMTDHPPVAQWYRGT